MKSPKGMQGLATGARLWRSGDPCGAQGGGARRFPSDRRDAGADRTWHAQAGRHGVDKVIRSDAAVFEGEQGKDYDLICSFSCCMKCLTKKVGNRRQHAGQTQAGQENRFVDYHDPKKWQPVPATAAAN